MAESLGSGAGGAGGGVGGGGGGGVKKIEPATFVGGKTHICNILPTKCAIVRWLILSTKTPMSQFC